MAIKRERLVHPFFIALFGAVIAFGLGLMFPHERLVERLKHAQANALSVAYLEVWLRIRHDDLELTGVLARQYISAGRLSEADPLVARLLAATDPLLHGNALLLAIEINEQRAYALPPEDPLRTALLEKVSALLSQTQTQLNAWDIPTLLTLATKSRALNLSELSATFYRRLAKKDPAHAVAWQALAGELSLENSHYHAAALAAFAAQTAATSLADQRRYFLLGLQALQAGNLLQLAMTEAQERAGPFLENDAQTLRFLTLLARSANRPDLAEKYAKHLLSVMQTSAFNAVDLYDALAVVNIRQPVYLDGIKGNALRETLERNNPTGTAGILRVAASSANNTKPANPDNKQTIEQDYELAFTVFLANRNLSEALRVADAAHRRTPGDPVWMKRRATVNEWSGQAAQALDAWLDMAHTTNSAEAWQAVLRLAPGLYNDAVYLEALRHQAGNHSELVLIDQIVAAYERLAQSDKALAFLDSQLTKTAYKKEILERYAALAERSGDDDVALRSYLRLNRDYGPQTAYALKLANIYNARSDFSAACNVLIAAQAKVAPADVFYWRALVQSAVRAEREDVARDASRHLIASNQATPADMENVIHLWDDYPIDAGRLAEVAFRQSGNIVTLQEAVYQYSRAKAWPRIDRLLNGLTPEQNAAAEASFEFLMAKAEFERQVGRNDAWLATLRAAIVINSSAGDARAAFLWALIDRGNNAELSATLHSWRDAAETDSELWAPYAAGYLRLSDQANCLHFFNKQGPEQRQDPLWALTYADALDDFGHADRAWSIRRQAWRAISTHRATLLGSEASAMTMQDDDNLAELRAHSILLSQSFAGGDFSRNLLLQVLRQHANKAQTPARPAMTQVSLKLLADDDSVTTTPTPVYAEATAEDAALAWSLSNEPYELAQSWMAQHYDPAQLEHPAYARITIALAADDKPALKNLLADHPDRLPLLNRIDANIRLDHTQEAQRLAANGLATNPDNEELQSRLQETALQNANDVEPRMLAFRQSPLRFVESDILVKQHLSEHLSLIVQTALRNQHSDDPTQLVNVPAQDTSLTLGLNWKTSDTDLLLQAGARRAVKTFAQARFEGSWKQQNAITWNAGLGFNQEATDSPELRIGGMKDTVSLGANWRVGVHEFIQGQAEVSRYYAQDRSAIGWGTQFELETGYHFRFAYPDFTLKAVATRANYSSSSASAGPLFGRFSPDGVMTVAEVLPASFTQAGLLLSFGMDLQETYTRAWRPLMEIGLLHDTRTGWNRSARVGLAGSVLGNDHAMLYYAHDRSAKNGGSPASEFGVRYRWYY
ncbi:tetratricopeptide repeat protein [Glaciimonas sp. GG7]